MEKSPLEFSKEYWIAKQFGNIPELIINYLKSVIDNNNGHISKYFNRAFTRWMFNVIRNGKNPFKEPIKAKELIIEQDLDYFFTTKEIRRPELNWDWLDKKLESIFNDSSSVVRSINVRMDESSNFVFFDIAGTTFKISSRQYDLALGKFKTFQENKSVDMFNEYLAILVTRYITLGTTNNHCSVPPHVIEFCNIRTELFGSPLNTFADQYCSPMYDIERFFGSIGSFFDFNICSGTYLLNPPYDELIINTSVKKIFSVLETSKEITVIIVLPIWDIETQIIMERRSPNVEFPIISTIKENKYTRSHRVLNCNIHKFYNYYVDEFLPITDTHLFVLSNTNYNLTAYEIAKEWEKKLTPRKY